MNSDTVSNLAENKLILLYTLSKIELPISNQQINKFILDNKFMNYFSMQEYLNELCEDKLVSSTEYEGKSCYLLTDKGRKILEYFSGHIPKVVKVQIDLNIPNIKKSVKNELFITSNLKHKSNNDYIVECKIKEQDFDLINLKLHVGSKPNANNICVNWKKHSEIIYNDIIDILTKKR
ncbi:MAG: DUF4364 family protein [Clostridiales bacterium]